MVGRYRQGEASTNLQGLWLTESHRERSASPAAPVECWSLRMLLYITIVEQRLVLGTNTHGTEIDYTQSTARRFLDRIIHSRQQLRRRHMLLPNFPPCRTVSIIQLLHFPLPHFKLSRNSAFCMNCDITKLYCYWDTSVKWPETLITNVQ